MRYLMNTWYVAAWASELTEGALLARTLLDAPVVLFRDADGQPHALHDRCPHRFAPLSRGRLAPDRQSVQCGYHGLCFDGSGACVRNPHGDGRVPRAAVVRSYPVVERFSCLWIWMGEPQRADAALIPDFACMDPALAHVGQGYLHVGANYQLETDNILDLSHIEFLHPGTLGSEAVKRALTEVRQEGRTVWSLRQTVDEVLPEMAYQQFGVPPGMHVDRWIDVRWDAPANMLLFAGTTPTGRPRSEAVGLQVTTPQLFTPETARSTHYWFSVCLPKSHGPHAAQIVEQVVQGLKVPFDTEDKPMLEAQQQRIGDAEFWSLKPVLLVGDAAAVRVRRALDELIAAELLATDAAVAGVARG